MTTVDTFAALNSANTGAKASTTGTQNEVGSADRFLKLLVTQMQNQDPLNPTDNAQITSQMAQINTVSGIDKLNTTVSGLNTQFMQMQALQGVALVGRDVTVKGNGLAVGGEVGVGAFRMDGAADKVKVEIMNPAGKVVDTLELGAASSGEHTFQWKATGVADDALYTFRVSATSGAAAVPTTSLMLDRVGAVSTNASGALVLELQRSGNVAYSDIQAFN